LKKDLRKKVGQRCTSGGEQISKQSKRGRGFGGRGGLLSRPFWGLRKKGHGEEGSGVKDGKLKEGV